MAAAKKEKQFHIVIGFNIPDPASEDGGELRFEPGSDKKPVFVKEADFDPDHWKALIAAGAIVEYTED